MIKLGQFQLMRVTRVEKDGTYLTSDYDNEAIIFRNELKETPEIGTEFNVFVYSDADHPFIATLKKPHALVNEFALMRVLSVTEKGAFLDWGINKDLFVPFAEQGVKMLEGRSYLVRVFKDELTERMLGSSKIHRFINNENISVKAKDEVSLIVWERSDLGVKVIINEKNYGLIFQSDVLRELNVGERLTGYIKNIREDERIDVTLRKPGHHEINEGEFFIMNYLEKNDGFLDMNDDSDPQEIKDRLHMSKKTFKKAIGALYKQRLIRLEPEGIYLVEDSNEEKINPIS